MMFLFVLLFTSTYAIINSDYSSIPGFPSYDDRRDIHVYAPSSTSSIITSIIGKTLEGNATFFEETASGNIIMNMQNQNYTDIPNQGSEIPKEDLCPSLCERFGYSLVTTCRDPSNVPDPSVTDENSCEYTGNTWKDACFDTNGVNINETLCHNKRVEKCKDAFSDLVSFVNQTDCESRGIIDDGIEYKHTFNTQCLSTTDAVLNMSECNNVVAPACFNNTVYMPGVPDAYTCTQTGRTWTTECSDGTYATEPLCHFGSSMEVESITLYNIEERSTIPDDNTNDNTDDVVDPNHRPSRKSLNFEYATLPAQPQGAFIAEWTNTDGSTIYLIVYDDDEFEYVYPKGTSCASAQIKGMEVFIQENQNIRFHEGYSAESYEYFSPEHDKFKATRERINAVSNWNTLRGQHVFSGHVLEFLDDSTDFTVDSNSNNIVCTNFCQYGCEMKYKEFGVFGNPTIRSGMLDDNTITSELGTTVMRDVSLNDTLVVDTDKPIKIQGTMTISGCKDIQDNRNQKTTWEEAEGDYATLKFVCNDTNKMYMFTNVDMKNIQLDVQDYAGSIHFKNSRYEISGADAILGSLKSLNVVDSAIYLRFDTDEEHLLASDIDFQNSFVRIISRNAIKVNNTMTILHSNFGSNFEMIDGDNSGIKATDIDIQESRFFGDNCRSQPYLQATDNIVFKNNALTSTDTGRSSCNCMGSDCRGWFFIAPTITIENVENSEESIPQITFDSSHSLTIKTLQIDTAIIKSSGTLKVDNVDSQSVQLLGEPTTHALNDFRVDSLELNCHDWVLKNTKVTSLKMKCGATPKTLNIQSLELNNSPDDEKTLELQNTDALIYTKNKAVFNQIKLKNSQLFLFGVRRPWTQEITFSENAEPYSKLFLGHEVTVLDIQNPEITTVFKIVGTTETVQHNYMTPSGSIYTKIAIPSIVIRNTGSSSYINSVSPTVKVKSISAMVSSDIEYIELQDYVGLDVEDKRQYCEPGYRTTENGCDACPKGTYSNRFDSGACKDCPRGLYNDETGQRVCKRCPTNATSGFTYRTQDSKSESASDCMVTTKCSAGLYFYDKGCHAAQECDDITDAQRFKENKKCKCGDEIIKHDDEIIEHNEYCINSNKSVNPLCSHVNGQAPCVGTDGSVSVDESSNEPKVQTGCPASDQPFIGNPKSSRFNLNNIIVVGNNFACECGSNKCTAGQFCHDDKECRDRPQCKNNAFVSEDCFCKTTRCEPNNVCIDGKCQKSCDDVLSTAGDKTLGEIVSKISKHFASVYTGQDIQKWVTRHSAQKAIYLEKFEDATDSEHEQIWANTESNINAPLHPFHYQMEDFILDKLRYDFNFYSERLTSEDLISEVFSYFYPSLFDSDTVAAVKSGKCHSGICFSASKGLSRSNFAVYEQIDITNEGMKLLDTPFQRMFPEDVPMYKNIEACCGDRTYESDPFVCDATTYAKCVSKNKYTWQNAYVKTPSRLRNPLDASWNQHNVPNIERNIPTFKNGIVMTKGEYVYTVWFAYIDTLQRYIESTYIGSRPYVIEKCMCHTDSFDKVQGCSTTQYCQHGRCRFTPLDDCAYTRGMAVNQNECICGNTACDLNNYCVKATSTCLQESVASIQ